MYQLLHIYVFNSKRLCFLLLSMVPILYSCTPDSEVSQAPKQKGYRPVYVSYEEMKKISTAAPKPIEHAGKIYVKDNYVFVNEINQGIHIINNQNPRNPEPVSFIVIPGNVDVAVKGNVLYADNATDLITLDISDPTAVKLLKRIENAFPYQSYPPQRGVNFECVDQSKGIVVRWEEAELENPKCFR